MVSCGQLFLEHHGEALMFPTPLLNRFPFQILRDKVPLNGVSGQEVTIALISLKALKVALFATKFLPCSL